MKKLIALVLALTMVLTCVAAFASAPDISDTNGSFTYTDVKHDSTTSSLKVTNTGSQTHTFTLYKLFVGDVTSSGTTHVFSNITWGNGVTDAGIAHYGDATEKAKSITTAAEAKAFADDLIENDYLQNGNAQEVATTESYTWTGLNPGYYLIRDTTDGLTDKDDSISAYIMQVVGVVERNAKISIPTVTKKVLDQDDSTGTNYGYLNTADYDVGDKVPFQITGTLPTNYGEYETYKAYNFVDTLSPGLTAPEAKDISIKKNGTEDISSHFDIAVNGQKITITLKEGEDLKNFVTKETDTIVVTYEATLNSNAVIGVEGNPNEVDLIFSNNPNQNGDGETGKTHDYVVVFTYKVEVNKVTGATGGSDGTALPGAAFALYKKYATVPEGKEAATEIKYDNNQKTYTIADGDKWVLVGTTTADSTTSQFDFDRVDDGYYLLVETTTPAGYNSIEPKEFHLESTHNQEDKTVTNVYGEGLDTDPINLGTLTIDTKIVGVDTKINNEGGITLPSTGGIGTTIFYILGGLLVVGAAVILVARRKASN